MKRPSMERILWIAALVAIVVGAYQARPPISDLDGLAASMALPTLRIALPSADSLIDAIEIVRDGDLFRSTREYQDIAMVEGGAVIGNPPPGPVRAPLILRGLIGGRNWVAIVEGIPGTEGAVMLRMGQSMNGVSLDTIRRDTAFLVGKDTTWKLAIRRDW